MKIIYIGTPDYSIPPLLSILEAGYEVPLVVTRPDVRQGRGRKKEAPPIKKEALKQGLRVYQPDNINSEQAKERLSDEDPDLFVVCSFGKLLDSEVLDIPERGSLNLHPSLLPRYRGPAPVANTLLNGDTETGVTVFWMDENMDSGPIIEQVRTEVKPDETCGDLRNRLFELAGEILPDVLKKIKEGRVRLRKQDDDEATYAPMLSKADGRIEWESSAPRIASQIRAVQPWPRAYTWIELEDREDPLRANIIGGKVRSNELSEKNENKSSELTPGTIVEVSSSGLSVQTGDGIYTILEIQPENTQPMDVQDFINGYQPEVGDSLRSSSPEAAGAK